jgi:hypothetical protein
MSDNSIDAPICKFSQRGRDREKSLHAFLPAFECSDFHWHFAILLRTTTHNKNNRLLVGRGIIDKVQIELS